MKKSSLTLIAMIAFAAIFVCTQARGQEYSAPIPVGSTQAQVGSGAPATKTNATSIKFSTLPDTSSITGSQNFRTNTIEFGDGTVSAVQDIVGTPGLLKDTLTPLPPPDTVGGMLDDMQPEEALGAVMISPTHGFCPEQWSWILSSTARLSINFQCNVLAEVLYPAAGGTSSTPTYKKNRFDHQYEVADIRNFLDGTEFGRVFGGMDPLEANLIGDAEEGLLPYQPIDLYPATLINESPDETFAWKWFSYDGKLTKLDEGYDHVYASSLSEIEEDGGKGGFVSVAYDPLNLEKQLKASWIVDIAPTWHLVGGRDLRGNEFVYKLLHSYFSPLVYFRKDTVNDRLRLAGYSTWQLGNIGAHTFVTDFWMFIKKILLSINSGPISVRNFKEIVGGSEMTRISVVNQATLGSLEQSFLNAKGIPFDFDPTTPAVDTKAWRDLLLDESGTPIQKTGLPGDAYIPHKVVSYIIFNEKPYNRKWINDPSDNYSDNPNEFTDPIITRREGGATVRLPGFALVGPGAFDSTVIRDAIGGAEKASLIVPSGDKAMDDKYYIYKYTPNDAKKFYFYSVTPTMLMGIVGEPYAVETPGYGWVPFSAVAGDINGGNCQDFVMSFRGAQTLWNPAKDSDPSTDWFDNHNSPRADQVHFDNTKLELKQMFSECVDLHYGYEDGGKCKYNEAPDQRICLKKSDTDPAWQIAKGIAISDTNSDGRNDLVIGNLNPMLMAGTDPKTYTAYAAIFENTAALPSGNLFTDDPNKTVRVGYAKTDKGPLPDDDGQYLVDVWSGKNGLAGVSELAVGENGEIGSTIGFPLMYAPYGCPKFSADIADTDIESPLEVLWSLIYNFRNPGVSTGPGGNVMPMRCLASTGTPIPAITITPAPYGTLHPFTPPPPCVRPTDPELIGNCVCPHDMSVPPSSWMTICCVGCDTPEERTTFDVYCNWLIDAGICPSSALSLPQDKLYADSRGGDSGSGGDSGGTDFAKCDRVYDSKAPYIASIRDLKLAQAEMNLPPANANVANNTQIQQLMDRIKTFLIEDAKFTEAEANAAIDQIKQAASGPNKMVFDELIRPFIETILDQYNAAQEGNVAPEKSTRNEPDKKWFSLISEAYANPIGGSGIPLFTDPSRDPAKVIKSNFRFGRGHDPALAEKREITVVQKKVPITTLFECGNGTWDAGEECDPGDPTATPPVAPGHLCEDTTLECNSACRCVPPGSTPPDCPNGVVQTDLGEECDKLPDDTIIGSCTPDEVCSILCRCVPKTAITGGGATEIPVTMEEAIGAPTIVSTCKTFSSPAVETYFKDLNDKARSTLPGLKTSDLFCEEEGTMEVSIIVPGADKGIGALIQLNGELPQDFTEWTELKGTVNIATQPTKLLPVDTAKGMKVVTPDLSASVTGLSEGVVPLASDVVTSVNATDNAFMLNNVLSWEMTAAPSKQVGVEAVENKIFNRVQPLLKSWSASGESEAFEAKNMFANYDMNQVLTQLAANSSLCHDGYCELKAVKDLWPDYQTYSLMLVQGIKATRAGGIVAPAKVEFAYLGTPSSKAMGGGPSCKCDMTALPPDAASIIALLIITAVATTGFVVVRVRARKK